MMYMGSKARIAKHLIPVMTALAESSGLSTWVEPFVGGGNMIDKVPDTFTRVGFDFNPHTIAALTDIRDNPRWLPDSISEEEYALLRGSPPGPISSWVRFCCSFGAKFEGGFARNKQKQNYCLTGKRNALKQSPGLRGVLLECGSYEALVPVNCVIYCDPPYQGTTGYKTGAFDHDKFFQWCRDMAKNNLVFVSEYAAPPDFVEVWSGEICNKFERGPARAERLAKEKLFLCI